MIGGAFIIGTLKRTVKYILWFGGVEILFYETLKEICQKKNTSPSAVCLAIGISKSNATEWKNGRSPKLDTVVEIANHLNISPSRLIPKKQKDEAEVI